MRPFKIPHLYQKRSLSSFHQTGGLQNEQSLHLQVFQTSKLWKVSIFGFFTKRETHQMSQVCIFKLFKSSTFVKRSLWVVFYQTDSLQNKQSLPFQSFEVSKQWKVLSFVKRCLSLVFHHSGKVTIWAKFGFSSFWNFKAFKSLHFCQKMCLVSFSPSRQFTKWTKFVFFQVFEIWSFNALKTSYFCQKRCLSSFPPSGRLTKWAKFVFSSFWRSRVLKSSYFCQKMCVGSFHRVFVSVSAFQKKIMVPTSLSNIYM